MRTVSRDCRLEYKVSYFWRKLRLRMVKIYISAVIFFCFGMVAAAQDYNGLCFPGDGCTGIVPINDGTFFTCEENCVMEEATLIRGMDALLFDVTCRGDSGAYSYRMMLALSLIHI